MKISVVVAACIVLTLTWSGEGAAQRLPDFPETGTPFESGLGNDDLRSPPEARGAIERILSSEEEAEHSSSWHRPIIGGVLGAAIGYVIGWEWDVVGDDPAPLDGSLSDGYHYRIRGALIGFGAGALGGFLLNLL